jgi:hypothetical protein
MTTITHSISVPNSRFSTVVIVKDPFPYPRKTRLSHMKDPVLAAGAVTANIYTSDGNTISGNSLCSVKDEWDVNYGMELALQRVLTIAKKHYDMSSFVSGYIMMQFYFSIGRWGKAILVAKQLGIELP